MRMIDSDALKRSVDNLFDRFGEDFHKSAIDTEIDEAKTVDAAEVLRNQWISVKDRLPKAFEPVIVCREEGKVEQGYKDVGDWWKVYGTRTKKVTHWMPLPDPPEEVKP